MTPDYQSNQYYIMDTHSENGRYSQFQFSPELIQATPFGAWLEAMVTCHEVIYLWCSQNGGRAFYEKAMNHARQEEIMDEMGRDRFYDLFGEAYDKVEAFKAQSSRDAIDMESYEALVSFRREQFTPLFAEMASYVVSECRDDVEQVAHFELGIKAIVDATWYMIVTSAIVYEDNSPWYQEGAGDELDRFTSWISEEAPRHYFGCTALEATEAAA